MRHLATAAIGMMLIAQAALAQDAADGPGMAAGQLLTGDRTAPELRALGLAARLGF